MTKPEGWRSNRNIVVMAAGCLVVLVVSCACSAAGLWYLFLRQPEHLNPQLSIPAEVEVGEEFVMQVTASNSSGASVTLNSIDIAEEFLVGFQVTGTSREPILTERIPIFKQRRWLFDIPISPDEETVFTFSMRALEAGRFSGRIDVCDSTQYCTPMFADVVVAGME